MKRFGLLFASCLAPLALQPAYAQTLPTTNPAPDAAAAVAEPEASAESGQLTDIVVTAQRRRERLQRVPIVVSAFSDQAIAQLHITDTLMTSKFVPGMISQHNAGLYSANAYYLRGLGNSQSTATFDAPVTTYVDDVYIARQNANNYAFFDTERVEVLRGPQGTLFGRNTTGGAINVIMRKPSDQIGLSTEATGGSYDRFTFKATADIPVTDKILTKISGFAVNDKGYLNDITTGQRLNGESNYGIRADVRLLPVEGLTVDLSTEFTSGTGTYQGLRSVASTALNSYLKAPTFNQQVFYETAAGLPNGHCTGNNVNTLQLTGKGSCSLSENYAVSGNIAYELGNGTLNYIGAYRHLGQGYITQYDANTTNKYAAYILVDNGQFDQVQQELKYNGDAFHDRLHYVTGVFYFHEKNNDRQTTFSGGKTAFRAIQDQHLLPTVSTVAVYGQVDYDVSKQLMVTLGGRYTYEYKTVNYLASTQFAGLGYTGAQVAAFNIPLTQTENRFTPRVAISYKVTPDVLVFASATNGFKSGGWNGGTAAPQNAVVFSPEKTWSYEGGVKSELLDHHVRVNLTGYFARTQDLQVTAGVISPVTGVITSLPFNAGTLKIYGIEAETNFQVTRDFSLFANPSYMHGRYSYIVPTTTSINTSFIPVRVPTFQFNGGAAYMTAVDWLGGSLGGSATYRHNAPYYIAVLNTTKTQIENYVDGAINFESVSKKMALSFEVSNLTKQKTVTANFLSLFPGDPRRFTVRLKLKI